MAGRGGGGVVRTHSKKDPTMKHKHRPIRELHRERGFAGPVPFPIKPNPAAHGWVTLFDTCRCGFERRINENGQHSEVGRWHDPDLGPDAR